MGTSDGVKVMEMGRYGGERMAKNTCGSGEVPCQGFHNRYVPCWETCKRQSGFHDTSLHIVICSASIKWNWKMMSVHPWCEMRVLG